MADIDGDGQDDYLHVSENGEVYMYWNVGNAPDSGPNAGKVQWRPIGVIASGGGAKGYQVRFADIDGDGRAEFIWVKDSGSATVWWNKGFSSDGKVKVIWGPGAGEEVATGIGDGQGKSVSSSFWMKYMLDIGSKKLTFSFLHRCALC